MTTVPMRVGPTGLEISGLLLDQSGMTDRYEIVLRQGEVIVRGVRQADAAWERAFPIPAEGSAAG